MVGERAEEARGFPPQPPLVTALAEGERDGRIAASEPVRLVKEPVRIFGITERLEDDSATVDQWCEHVGGCVEGIQRLAEVGVGILEATRRGQHVDEREVSVARE